MPSISYTCTIDDPATQTLEVYRGGYTTINYTCQDNAGSAVDLTGATIKLVVWDIEAGANEFVMTMVPVSDASWTSNVVTFTAVAHGYDAGDSVIVEDAGNTSYNGTYTVVAAPDDDTFTAALVGDPGAWTTDGYTSAAAGNISMTTQASGLFKVALTDAQTDTDCKMYRYALWIALAAGTEHHAAQGTFLILDGVYDS